MCNNHSHSPTTVITNSACMNHYQKIMSSHGFSPHGWWAHPLGLIRYFCLSCFFSGFSKWDCTFPSSSVVAYIVVFCGGAGGRWVFIVSLFPDCSTVVWVGLPIVFVFLSSCSFADDGVGLVFSLGCFLAHPRMLDCWWIDSVRYLFVCLFFSPPSSHACSSLVLMDWVSSCSVFRFSAHWWARLLLLVAMLAFPSPSALASHKHSSPSLSSLSSPSSCSSSALLCVVEALPSSCCSTFQASFRLCGNSKSRAASSCSSKVPFPSYRSVEAASSACCYSKNYEAASLSSSSCSKLGARLSLNSRPPHPLQSCRPGVLSGSLRKMRSPCSSLCLQAPNQARYAENFLCGVKLSSSLIAILVLKHSKK